MVCVLSFLVVTGSACFLNREQEKEEKLKAVYAAESTVSRVKSQLNRYLAESELVKNIIESGYDIDGENDKIISSNEDYSIVIFGNTHLSHEVIFQACIMGQLPNENKLTIYCLDKNPKRFQQKVALNYTEINNIPNIKIKYQ